MHDYSRYYAILGVSPDTDWKAVRACYRRLIGQWHPDRFSTDAPAREIAEERSKQITNAYQALERYHRNNGVLPPMEPAAVAVNEKTPARDADVTFDRTRWAARASTARSEAIEDEQAKRTPGRRRRAAIAMTAVIAAAYLGYRFLNAWIPGDDQPGESAREPDVAPRSPPVAESPRETGGISAGSTFGEVYAIQGVPTMTQGDTWYYGRSSIRFYEGKVISWEAHFDNPLRIARDQPVQLREGSFSIGSTKDEVREIQGAPVTETDTVWDYGPSRVYFQHNRVVRWENSALQPLRVQR
ncbi:MAG: J domain-containing protein [Burkholderiales bacterium]